MSDVAATLSALDFESVVIGTGFGGAIAACRAAKRWPGRILVLERGKRYPMGAFPRTPKGIAENFWNLPTEDRARPRHVPKRQMHGMFDVRSYHGLDAVVCAGLGGGSLIYANVFLEPPDQVFAIGWPRGLDRAALAPYYAVAKAVLGARPIPDMSEPRRVITRTEMFQRVARAERRATALADINVFFGNDHTKPLAIGAQDRNQYGALQTSCVYCGECDVGCNTHSKNTVDLNYLFVAEHRYGAKILTETLGVQAVPLAADGGEDPGGSGEYGYRVTYIDLAAGAKRSVTAARVVVSCGAQGSTELLLRCRDVFRTLPRISSELGRKFSANGDFLSFVFARKSQADPNYGPVITQYTDYNLFNDFISEHAFILEDAAFPAFASWYIEGARPALSFLPVLWAALEHLYARWVRGASLGRLGFLLGDILRGDWASRVSVLLWMGLDAGEGTMKLNRSGYLDIDWPVNRSMALYSAIAKATAAFGRHIDSERAFALPTWWWPLRRNITVHSLGGCRLGDGRESGVTNAARQRFGEVFGYTGLYVADGGLVPTAVGANPIATISALSEMVAEGMTGLKPDAGL
jgi:cholesterol oxidase